MSTKVYYPEMGDEKPAAVIEASLGHYGKHYYLTTTLELKGRGIKQISTSRPGMNRYKVTIKAYEKLEAENDISYQMLLS